MPQPHVNGYNSFPQTGWNAQSSVLHASTPASLAVLAQPGVGKAWVVLGAATVAECAMKDDLGTTIVTLPADGGGWTFPGAVNWGENRAVVLSSSDSVTVWYYLHDLSKD